jgi:hypothetical protein
VHEQRGRGQIEDAVHRLVELEKGLCVAKRRKVLVEAALDSDEEIELRKRRPEPEWEAPEVRSRRQTDVAVLVGEDECRRPPRKFVEKHSDRFGVLALFTHKNPRNTHGVTYGKCIAVSFTHAAHEDVFVIKVETDTMAHAVTIVNKTHIFNGISLPGGRIGALEQNCHIRVARFDHGATR